MQEEELAEIMSMVEAAFCFRFSERQWEGLYALLGQEDSDLLRAAVRRLCNFGDGLKPGQNVVKVIRSFMGIEWRHRQAMKKAKRHKRDSKKLKGKAE